VPSAATDKPTLAYAQAMRGEERVRPRATPAGAFERARDFLRAGRRIDMVELAADIGVSRATLYRWTGDRERLLVDAVWAETKDVAEHIRSGTDGQAGASRILTIAVQYFEFFAANTGVNAFLAHERDAGLLLMTRVNGGFRPRAVAWFREVIQAEIDAGTYKARNYSAGLAGDGGDPGVAVVQHAEGGEGGLALFAGGR
jgi:AcrR family transcriptional regulator